MKDSLIKAITYRVFATIITGLVVFVYTGDLIIVSGIVAVDFVLKILGYWAYEILWNKYHLQIRGLRRWLKDH